MGNFTNKICVFYCISNGFMVKSTMLCEEPTKIGKVYFLMEVERVKKEREGNFDLLRIICAIAVIMIHVSAFWVGAITNDETFGELYLHGILTSCSYNVLSRFAVPCFVMLSGAFILADERNAEYKQFYKKTFCNVGIPTLIFSILYFAYSIVLEILAVVVKGKDYHRLLTPIKDLIKGAPYYHMWYLYMMIGVYLLVPIIISFKKQVGEKIFSRVAWIFLAVACASYWTSTNKLNWDIGLSFQFVGYLMVGYELRKIGNTHKNNRRGLILIILGIAIEIIIIALRYKQALAGIEDADLKYKLVSPLCPLVIIASVLIFAGFSHLTIKKDFGKLSALTFLIYLFHAGFWNVLSRAVGKLGYSWNNRIVLPCSIIVIFIVSVVASIIYKKIWKWIEGKWNVSTKLCRLLKLE